LAFRAPMRTKTALFHFTVYVKHFETVIVFLVVANKQTTLKM